MSESSDLPQRLSDACMRTTLALMVLSAGALGLAEKFQAATHFQAYAQVEMARGILEALLADLANDNCWRSYVRTLPESQLAANTTLAELKGIECTSTHNKMRIDLAIWGNKSPSAIDPASLRFLESRPAIVQDGEKWYELGATEMLEHYVAPLWNDELLNIGQRYSVVAKDDIYRWQLYRFRLQQRRGLPLVPERLSPGGAISESNFLNLTVGDLGDVSHLAHSALSDLDRAVHEEFRASLPSVPMDFGVATAAGA